MRKWLVALALAALPATAQDCLTGNDCSNSCPLAKHANTRLATGNEAMLASPSARTEYVKSVLGRLETI